MSRPAAFLWLLLPALLAFGVSLLNPFLFDDAGFITQNRWLRMELIPNFFRSFVPTSNWSFVGYRPLLMTTFTLERELFQNFPWVMRLTNLLLHAAVAFLVFENARRILKNDRLALFAASLFLLHPVQTNVITLVWKRSDLLVALGIFSSLLFLRRWSEPAEQKAMNLLGVFAGTFVALFSKESALILPLVLILAETWLWSPKRPFKQRILFVYLPLALIFTAHAWVVFSELPKALASVKFQGHSFMPPSLWLDRWDYLKTQGACFLDYLSLTFWPAGLRVFHWVPPVHSWLDPRFLFAAFTVILMIFGALILKRKEPAVSFGILWFLLVLIPSSSFVPLNMPFDEDRLYLPLFGFALAIASLEARVFDHLKGHRLAASFLRLFPVILCVLFVVHDVFRVSVWRDPIRLWTENAADDPEDPRPWVNLGEAFRGDRKHKLAVAAYEKASQVDPEYGLPSLYLGIEYLELGDFSKAEEKLQEALVRNAFFPDVLLEFGVLNSLKNRPGEAARFFSLTLHANPGKVEALRNYATLLEKNGEEEGALKALRAAIVIDPEDSQTQLRLAYFLWDNRHDRDGALVFLEEVLQARPNDQLAQALARRLGVR